MKGEATEAQIEVEASPVKRTSRRSGLTAEATDPVVGEVKAASENSLTDTSSFKIHTNESDKFRISEDREFNLADIHWQNPRESSFNCHDQQLETQEVPNLEEGRL